MSFIWKNPNPYSPIVALNWVWNKRNRVMMWIGTPFSKSVKVVHYFEKWFTILKVCEGEVSLCLRVESILFIMSRGVFECTSLPLWKRCLLCRINTRMNPRRHSVFDYSTRLVKIHFSISLYMSEFDVIEFIFWCFLQYWWPWKLQVLYLERWLRWNWCSSNRDI